MDRTVADWELEEGSPAVENVSTDEWMSASSSLRCRCGLREMYLCVATPTCGTLYRLLGGSFPIVWAFKLAALSVSTEVALDAPPSHSLLKLS